MTIITKAIGEKKALEKPLVVENSSENKNGVDPESQREVPGHLILLRTRVMRFHNMPTAILFITAILVMGFGILGGIFVYRQYAKAQMHRFRTGWYSIPLEPGSKAQYTSYLDAPRSDLLQALTNEADEIINEHEHALKYFQEKFDFDLDNHKYEIAVPDFKGGRSGRIIHDFSINKTGIIDIQGKSCFVLDLDREKVLPPKNLFDLLKKMNTGYYEVDTEVVRETMKVVGPPIDDFSNIGTYITRECQNRPTYMLEKVNMKVIKRSASIGVFGQFAGNKIIELNIINMDLVEQQ